MSIQDELNQIKNAVYGTDVRDAIHDGVEKGYNKAEQAESNSLDIKQTYDEILMNWESDPNKDPEVIAARGGLPQLEDRLNETDAQLAQIDTQTNEDALNISSAIDSGWWKAPKQPSFNGDDPEYNSENALRLNDPNTPYDWFINRLWDKFIDDTNLNGYVSKTIQGKDQSGTYDIYRYEFTPENYTKTIILGNAIHGWETIGTAVLSRLMHHICYDWREHPKLSNLRHNVRIIIMPFENPWGYENGGVRQNSRGVDLNRNFDYLWDNFTPSGPYDAKGDAPSSEVETQYIINTLNAFSDAVAYLDFHNMKSTADGDLYIYDSTLEPAAKNIPPTIFGHYQNLNTVHSSNMLPNAFNYAAKNNMHSSNPEFVAGKINPAMPYGSDEMTVWVEFATNLVMMYLENEKPSYSLSKEPFNVFLHRDWVSGAGLMPGTSYAELNMPTYTFTVPCDGILTVDQNIVYIGKDENARFFFIPLVGQNGNNFTPSKQNSQWEVYKDCFKLDGRDMVNTLASIPVQKGQDIQVGVYARTTIADSLEISRYRANITFIPSFGKHRQRSLFLNSSGEYADFGYQYE